MGKNDNSMDLFLGNAARTGTKPTRGRNWTSQQNAFFDEVLDGTGNLELESRAGTGKSTTILEAARRLPERANASLTAFNRSIADELKKKAPESLRVKTFHAAGFAILKAHDRTCTIDEDKGIRLAREVAGAQAPQKLVTIVKRAASMCKSYLVEDVDRALEVFEDHDIEAQGFATQEELAKLALQAMQGAKEMMGLVDFDDQVWLPIVMNLKPRYTSDLVFVDEAQDMAENQLRLAFSLAGGIGRIITVYDPFQAIYSWRGAGAGMFQRMLAGLNSKKLQLTVTFRCGKNIVKRANEFVPDIEAMPGAEDGTVTDISTVDLVKEARPGDVIISRSNSELIKQCTAFIRAGIKSNIIGRDLGQTLSGMVQRSHASDVEELLEWVNAWELKEVVKRQAKDQDVQPIQDRAACIKAFAEGARSIGEVNRNIAIMFDDTNDENRIVFSSTHRFKGMERNRVFLLWDTYLHARPTVDKVTGIKKWDVSQEERNLAYVAITRARSELFFVRGKGPSDG